MELSGCSAVVTGAASGLGAATASELASRGVSVLGIDLASSISSLQGAQGEQGAQGADSGSRTTPGVIHYVAADVTDEAQIGQAFEALRGLPPLRLVVNCAGIAPARRILSSKGVHDLELFRRVIDINLTGTFNVLRLASEVMAGQDPIDGADLPGADLPGADLPGADKRGDGQRGVIINTASVAAYEGQIGQAAYAASKGGIVALTIAAARDLARNGIRVNTIAPGIVATPLLESLGAEVGEALAEAIPFPARAATPAEFARLVTMIAEHDYLNGETIRMDGALRMGPS